MKKQRKMLNKLNLSNVNNNKLTKDSKIFLVFDGIDDWTDFLKDAIVNKQEYVLKGELESNSHLTFIMFCALRIMDDLKEKAKKNNKEKPKKPDKAKQIELIMNKIRSWRANNNE